MTRTNNARLAGLSFLCYIAVAMTGMAFFGRATHGASPAEKLASIASHTSQMGIAVVCTLITIICALVLAVTLFSLTREQDPDLALLAMTCRVTEGCINAIPALSMLALLWLATDASKLGLSDSVAANALCALLVKLHAWVVTVGATVFSVGSGLYSYLFLRARSLPASLSRLGVFASLLMMVALPLDGLRLIPTSALGIAWLPMLVFEVTLAFWLMLKGVTIT